MTYNEDKIRELRQALGTFPTGVTVVTTLDPQGAPLGFTANSFTSVSLDPPLVLVCMSKGSCNFDSYRHTQNFAINVLADQQRGISTTFAMPSEDRFRDVDWRIGVTGSPILEQVVSWFDCQTHEVIDAGDHVILMGRVVEFQFNDSPPLGYLRGNYVNFALEQNAAAAMENPDQETCVGAIIEHEQRLFLCPNKGKLDLPKAAYLGFKDQTDSLYGKLQAMGVNIQALYLFAVFDNKQSKTSNIYYRGVASGLSEQALEYFYPMEAVPFDQLQDGVVASMIRRYIHEHSLNAFGIYVGDEYSGVVELLGIS